MGFWGCRQRFGVLWRLLALAVILLSMLLEQHFRRTGAIWVFRRICKRTAQYKYYEKACSMKDVLYLKHRFGEDGRAEVHIPRTRRCRCRSRPNTRKPVPCIPTRSTSVSLAHNLSACNKAGDNTMQGVEMMTNHSQDLTASQWRGASIVTFESTVTPRRTWRYCPR